ncbi:12362_t:CDS:2 [Ambispora gerdemannii]|uniref:12362_t:CDS:1 n=1 Tax=Ambispora gerdemannii TaxID=144530 RepID=A0A9N9E358_9GLOM|nr:12362_t:CDS:2 [Ambispora gerdemannii]
MATCKANSCYTSTNYSYKDYCSYHQKCLSKLRNRYGYGYNFSNIQEIETFETYFNGNCGYVINYDSSSSYPYYIWIVVYEPAVKSIGERLSAIKYKCGYSSLSGASDKARRIKSKLQNNGFEDTPMIKVHPEAKNYEYFNSLISSPYVIQEDLYHKITEPDRYFKTLDIAKVDEGDYKHVGIYIGNDLVCHFTKKYKANRNCEHFANMIVYGINYSEQVKEKKGLIQVSRGLLDAFSPINNGKGSTIKLTNELKETEDKLG